MRHAQPPGPARFIAVDWGTTNFRASLVGPDDQVIARTQVPRGIRQVPEGGFAEALQELLAPWLATASGIPVLMAGMVGSVDGWQEVPYLPCPASLDDLARATVPIAHPEIDYPLFIVPGLSGHSVAGTPDVMRGEEVQVLGALASRTLSEPVLVLPGTHSKWVRLDGRRVMGFNTSMTGDVFAAIRQHTILSRFAATGGADREAFMQGLDRSAAPGGLLHHLFSARTEVLLGDLAAEQDAAYLSGLLIGHECRAMVEALHCDSPVAVIGNGALTELYNLSLEQLGLSVRRIDGDSAAIRGLSVLMTQLQNLA